MKKISNILGRDFIEEEEEEDISEGCNPKKSIDLKNMDLIPLPENERVKTFNEYVKND